MSPEQWLGRQADARTDQFSFCAALYEALHGVHAFTLSSQPARQAAISRGDLQTGEAALSVPGHVAAALRRGLSFRPEDRFPDLAALLTVLADDPAARRRRTLRGAGLLVLTGLLVAVVVIALQGVRQRWRVEQREADAAAALAGVDARIVEARAAGDRAAAERLLAAFLDEPVHKDTRAIARAWLGEAARRRDDGDAAAARSAYARAFAAASHADEGSEALLGLAALFRAGLAWDSLGEVLALLDRRHPDVAASPELAPLRADVALARRDFGGARDLLGAAAPARVGALLGALEHARATPFRHTRAVFGRVGDELWLHENRDTAVVHATRADPSLAPLWSHRLPVASRIDLVDPREPYLVAWEDTLALYERSGAGLAEVYRWPDRMLFAAGAADLDGDGRRELYIGTGTSCQLTELSRDDGGAWSHRVVYDVRDTTESAIDSLLALDLDGDGREELVAALGGWRAYDVRVLRKDPASGRLLTVARDKIGNSFGLGRLRGPGGDPLVVAEVFHRDPNPLVFPQAHPYGSPQGTYLLAFAGGRIERRAFVPFIHEGSGADSAGSHWQPLVGDIDGDGRDDFVNHFRHTGGFHSVVQLQGEAGDFAPVRLDHVSVLALAQLDDDPALELLVNDNPPEGSPALWALGVGDERLPIRAPPVSEDSSDRGPDLDPSMRRGLDAAGDLRAVGMFADAADAYQELAPLAAPGQPRAALLLDAAALRERLGDDARALELYRRAGDLDPSTDALRGAYRSQLRLGRYAEALATLEVLRHRPDLPAEENAARISEHARLTAALDDASTIDLTFDRPLAPAWTIRDPLALRRLPLAGALQIETTRPGVLAELPITWDGEVLDLTVDLAVAHTEWSTVLTVEIVPEDGGPSALRVLIGTHGTSRGGQPPQRTHNCVLGTRSAGFGDPEMLQHSPAAPERARLRAFTIGPLAEMGCSASDLDGGRQSAERHPLIVPLGAPGRYRLVLRAHTDIPAWLSAQIHRITIHGAHLRDERPADPDRAALYAALVEGDALPALAALDHVDPADPSARVARAALLTRLGRLADAAPLWRALLPDPDPAIRGALHTLLRGHHADFGPVLRDTSEPHYVEALAVAWRNTGVNHLDDPRVGPGFLDILQVLDPDRLAPAGAAEAEVLRAADLMTWRARLHARAHRRDAARDDFTRALELCRRAGPAAALRAGVLRLDLASLAAEAGDVDGARGHIRAAREVADMPLLVEDIIQAREELAALPR